VGRAERLWRWCRRRPAVAGLLAALVLAVTAAFAVITGLWLRAEEQRARARANEHLAEEQRRQADANYRLARQAVDEFSTKLEGDPRLGETDLEPLRRELLQTAVLFYQKFVQEHATDPAVRAELGSAYTRLASLTAEIGDKAKAIDLYRQALTVWEELAGANSTDPHYQDRQATCHHHLALLFRDTRQPGDAEKAHLRALGIQKALVANHPTVAQYKKSLALSHNSLGNLYRRTTGRLDEAEPNYTEARKILQELARTHPGESDYQFNLSTILNNLGVLYFRTDRPGDAEDAYKEAIRVLQELPPGQQATAKYQADLAGTYRNLGNLYLDVGQLDKAEEALQKAAEVADQLARGHPAVTQYQDLLTAAHNGLGQTYDRAGRRPEAEAAFRKALELAEPLAKKNPLVAAYAVRVGGIYCNLGNLAWDNDRFQESFDWFGRAIQTLEREKQDATAMRFLRNAYYTRGLRLSARDKHAEALKDLDQALEIEGGAGRDVTRSQKARVLARQGLHDRAVEEVKRLQGDKSAPTGRTLFNAACIYSLAATAARSDRQALPAEPNKLAEQYAARALDLLGQARAAGFFNVSDNRQELKTEKDLDPIRPRDDFKKLLSEVEAKAKPAN
jgi:tetratricopeptide (TPR) repeat protein